LLAAEFTFSAQSIWQLGYDTVTNWQIDTEP